MKHIFYFIGILFIIYEMIWIISPKEQTEKAIEIKNQTEKNKGKKWDEFTEEYKSILKNRGLASLILSIWMFAGLFTFNWASFLTIILFNFIIIAPIEKLTKYNKSYTVLHWTNSVIGFVFGVFVIINSYHLKIDVYDLILNFINNN